MPRSGLDPWHALPLFIFLTFLKTGIVSPIWQIGKQRQQDVVATPGRCSPWHLSPHFHMPFKTVLHAGQATAQDCGHQQGSLVGMLSLSFLCVPPTSSSKAQTYVHKQLSQTPPPLSPSPVPCAIHCQLPQHCACWPLLPFLPTLFCHSAISTIGW